ncbi:MAG: MBL fold metallo-hydrolase [Candidatus Cloacimonadaceae bacterium]|jgi:glyoxylase-like metal-dependent hydrolase (beta-lactamase superfamily II)
MKIFKVDAGHYYTDGGAMMGVNPWALWGKKEPTDERRRIRLALDLLLIVGHGRVILVDTGIGNRLSEKQIKIYKPSEYILEKSLAALGYQASDVTDVILSHLHFDHAGGLITSHEGEDKITFANARLWCQKAEWEMAKNPDGLNQAAYDYPNQLQALEEKMQERDGVAVASDHTGCQEEKIQVRDGVAVASDHTGSDSQLQRSCPHPCSSVEKSFASHDLDLQAEHAHLGNQRSDSQLTTHNSQLELTLVDGDAEIAPGVKVKKTGGHSVGSQIVEIEAQDGFYIYPADIIPTAFHLPLAITSAYDVNRKETYLAKQYIHQTIKERGGKLLLNHDNVHWVFRC